MQELRKKQRVGAVYWKPENVVRNTKDFVCIVFE